MNQRIDNQKNALQINLTSRKQVAFHNQMEAAWDADRLPVNPIKNTKLVSWLVQAWDSLYKLRSNQPACDCQSVCDCQTACECS